MTLQAFFDALEKRLAELNAAEMRAILRRRAREIEPERREAFLHSLEPVPRVDAARLERLFVRTRDFVAEMREFSLRLEEADYPVDPFPADPAEPPLPYAAKAREFAALLTETGLCFEGGRRTDVRPVYEELFQVFTLSDLLGGGIRPAHVAPLPVEARSRWMRAVYEDARPERRALSMMEALRWSVEKITARPRPRLADLLEAHPEPPPDWEPFLEAFAELSGGESGDAAADAWHREAVRLRHGIDGLRRLCRKAGAARPRVWLDLAMELDRAGEAEEALSASRDGLARLPAGLPLRTALADVMARSAAKLNRLEWLPEARWEAFAARPVLRRLLDLLETAPAGDERRACLLKAIQHLTLPLKEEEPRGAGPSEPWEEDGADDAVSVSPVLVAHARLLAGKWDQALREVADLPVLGWSRESVAQAVAVQGVAALLHGDPDNGSANLRQVWMAALRARGVLEAETDPFLLTERLREHYTIQLTEFRFTPQERDDLAELCRAICQRRIDSVVKHKHRRAYGKAARLACALVEMLAAGGWPHRATAFLHHCEHAHARRTDFQAELANARDELESVVHLDTVEASEERSRSRRRR